MGILSRLVTCVLFLVFLIWTFPAIGAEAFCRDGWARTGMDGWEHLRHQDMAGQVANGLANQGGGRIRYAVGDWRPGFSTRTAWRKGSSLGARFKNGKKGVAAYFETPFKIGGGGEKHGKGPKAILHTRMDDCLS